MGEAVEVTFDDKLQLDKEFSEISGRVWQTKRENQPELFHYTNARGLLGILKSDALWATHFQSLNDASEMRYGVNQARDVINAQKALETKGFLLDAMSLLDEAFMPPYVVSFCADGNLLSQWREYGDRGSGFSIGFDFEKLSTLFGTGTSILDIRYNPGDQCHVLSVTFEEYWSLFLRWQHRCDPAFSLPSVPGSDGSIEDHCRVQLASLLLTEFAAFKDPGFKEEKEWRLFRLGEGDLRRQFRTGGFGIVPYIELKPSGGQKLPIKKIIQGPTADRTSAKRSVQVLLEECNYAGVEVEVSNIPLR